MLNSPQFRIAVLLYLALFINLGPSFHRAPILGLHDNPEHSATCCCCCHHGLLGESLGEKVTGIGKQLCDCSLCKFFKYNQAELAANETDVFNEPTAATCEKSSVCATRITSSPLARGPPTA